MTRAGTVYLPERLHVVRIAVKKLRYGVELASELSSTSAQADIAVLKRVQALLGRMHDLQMLAEQVRGVQARLTRPDPVLSRELDALIIALDRSCRRLHARYVRERDPLTALCSRLAVRPRAQRQGPAAHAARSGRPAAFAVRHRQAG